MSANDPHTLWFDAFQHLGESRQTVQTTFDGVLSQKAIFETRCKLHFFRQSIHRTNLAVLDFCNDEVERIAAKIDGR